MKDKELRVVPIRNYLVLGIIILVTLFLVYYFYLWVDAYRDNKLNRPILDKYMEVINYNELDNYLIENPDTIIYVSVLENNVIRSFEKKFKKLLRDDVFNKDMLYMDITNDLNNKNLKQEIVNKYVLNGVSFVDVPVIAVFDNGILKQVYSISNNNYDIDSLKVFLNSIKFSEEDVLNG